jgi:oxygen-dependent protoporphyrinogen oxidase
MNKLQTIAIIGGGITGLSAAYYLQKLIREHQLPYQIKLIEASGKLGGKIQTVKRDGFIIERGPDSFLARKEPAVRLAESLGLTDELVRNQTGQAYIHVEDTLHKMPKGSYMGVPTSHAALRENSLLSEEGKKRAEADFRLPPGKLEGDQSLGQFFRRRFGDELVENVLEPLLSGIYSGDIDQMSLFATFPDFYELEQQYGSLIKGLGQTLPNRSSQTGKTQGQFYAFKDGLDTIVKTLAEELGEDVISRNRKVDKITFENGKYTIQAGETMEADAVIVTTSHQQLPKLFPEQAYFRTFEEVPSTSVANVALAFNESAIDEKLEGTGFVVSRNSDLRITACTWTHQKWEHTTPEGKALLRAYVGKPSDQEVVDLSDEEIVEIVLNDLKKIMDIKEAPEFSVVTKWKKARPQYTVGHNERVKMVRKKIADSLPGTFIAGSSYEGVGIPACIHQGEQMAERVVEFLRRR